MLFTELACPILSYICSMLSFCSTLSNSYSLLSVYDTSYPLLHLQVQRYEGASVTYGPHTLEAYQMLFTELAVAMATGQDVDEGPEPLDLRGYPGDISLH